MQEKVTLFLKVSEDPLCDCGNNFACRMSLKTEVLTKIQAHGVTEYRSRIGKKWRDESKLIKNLILELLLN